MFRIKHIQMLNRSQYTPAVMDASGWSLQRTVQSRRLLVITANSARQPLGRYPRQWEGDVTHPLLFPGLPYHRETRATIRRVRRLSWDPNKARFSFDLVSDVKSLKRRHFWFTRLSMAPIKIKIQKKIGNLNTFKVQRRDLGLDVCICNSNKSDQIFFFQVSLRAHAAKKNIRKLHLQM